MVLEDFSHSAIASKFDKLLHPAVTIESKILLLFSRCGTAPILVNCIIQETMNTGLTARHRLINKGGLIMKEQCRIASIVQHINFFQLIQIGEDYQEEKLSV